MKAVRRLIWKAYQPFRFAIVKPIENSGLYARLMEAVMKPFRKNACSFVGHLLSRSKHFKPYVVVRIDGGLGNQMFQYSLGRKVEESCALPVYYDVTWFARGGMDIQNRLNRNFELETAFPRIKLRKAGYFTSFIYRQFFKVYREAEQDMEKFVLSSPQPRYLEGFWQYRDDEIVRGDFVFGLPLSEANKAMLEAIESDACPVAVHVRRGDYIGSILEMTTPRYFKEAIMLVAENEHPVRPSFFVFSDDIKWCVEVLGGMDEHIVFVGNNDNDHGSADMYLMSRCRHFILSNSTFSYWASFLSDRSPDRLVITPSNDSARNYKTGGKLSGHISVPTNKEEIQFEQQPH